MVEALRPNRGGYLRPFGCAQFIISFLEGEGPNGSPRIDPSVGAPQTDIQAEYKDALHRAWAEDIVATEEERRARRKRPPLTIEEAERLTRYYMARIPMKFCRMRYHSFLSYFGMLKRLGWVEETDRTEPSTAQELMVLKPGEEPRETGKPRIFYRLTAKGRRATPAEVMNPLRVLYPQFTAAYFREKRRHHHYSTR